MKEAIHTDKAPAAIGPYSQAVEAGSFIYISGQLGLNPGSGEFAGEDIATQTRQALENMKAILNAEGCRMDDVVKTTVLLDDIDDFAAMNAVYSEYFNEPFPARAAFAVQTIPKNGLVEIEAVACK